MMLIKFAVLSLLVVSQAFANCKRDDFGYNTKTRQAVLIKRNIGSLKINRNGTVVNGKWLDIYDGSYFEGDPRYDIQIDHIVPIHYAIKNGACNWNKTEKFKLGNDMENLEITHTSYNKSKGADICWTPILDKCEYIAKLESLLWKYNLLPIASCVVENKKKYCNA